MFMKLFDVSCALESSSTFHAQNGLKAAVVPRHSIKEVIRLTILHSPNDYTFW